MTFQYSSKRSCKPCKHFRIQCMSISCHDSNRARYQLAKTFLIVSLESWCAFRDKSLACHKTIPIRILQPNSVWSPMTVNLLWKSFLSDPVTGSFWGIRVVPISLSLFCGEWRLSDSDVSSKKINLSEWVSWELSDEKWRKLIASSAWPDEFVGGLVLNGSAVRPAIDQNIMGSSCHKINIAVWFINRNHSLTSKESIGKYYWAKT